MLLEASTTDHRMGIENNSFEIYIGNCASGIFVEFLSAANLNIRFLTIIKPISTNEPAPNWLKMSALKASRDILKIIFIQNDRLIKIPQTIQ